jgi:hypothetical protein
MSLNLLSLWMPYQTEWQTQRRRVRKTEARKTYKICHKKMHKSFERQKCPLMNYIKVLETVLVSKHR